MDIQKRGYETKYAINFYKRRKNLGTDDKVRKKACMVILRAFYTQMERNKNQQVTTNNENIYINIYEREHNRMDIEYSRG